MRNQTGSPHVHDFHFRMLSRVKFKKGIGWKLGRLFQTFDFNNQVVAVFSKGFHLWMEESLVFTQMPIFMKFLFKSLG